MGDTRGYAHSTRLDPDHRIFGLSDYNLAASSAVEGLPDEQKSSPVRRTFLLMITFEFILTVVLWLIYLRTRGPIITSMTNEVKFYNFTSSLFDVQVLAASRFTALEICYGCILTSSRWPSIVFTTVSTVAVIIKCVMFDFGIASDSPLGLAYTILVYNIVMPWLVTVFFEYRVLPQERMAEQISKNIGRLNANVPNDLESVTYPSIHHWAATVAASTYAASIYASPRGSIIDDEEPLLQTRKPTDYGSTEAPFDVAALLIQASKVRNDAWSAYESAVWGSCPNPSLSSLPDFTPQTSSACLPGFKVKLFRVEGLIPAPSRMIFNDLVHGVEFSPHWNPTVASARYLQTFQGENLDIVHTMSKEVLGGLIKPRDFVLLRVWGESNGILYIASTSVLHPKCPPRPECIRGEQIISAIMLQPSGDVCRFVWISGIDLKGWLSNSLTERGLTVSMSTFFAAVLTRAESLCVNANPPRRSSLHTTHSSGLNETC